MSVRTAAQNFEHKPLNLAPKPFGANNNSKPKPSVKPSFLNDENRSIASTNKPVISTNDLSTFKFKNSPSKAKDEDKNIDSKPEFQNFALKSPAERQRQSLLKTNTNNPQKVIPPTPAKRPPPTDDELKVRNVEEKTADQLKKEQELKKLPSGSVQNSKILLFEKFGEPEIEAPRRRNTKSGGSFVSTSSTEEEVSPKLSTFKSPRPAPQIKKKPDTLPRKTELQRPKSDVSSQQKSPPTIPKKVEVEKPKVELLKRSLSTFGHKKEEIEINVELEEVSSLITNYNIIQDEVSLYNTYTMT
jgi:hypothetical protein